MDPLFVGALVAIVLLAFLYEMWQAVHGRPTISEQVWRINKLWPPILFLAGVLVGHLFTC